MRKTKKGDEGHITVELKGEIVRTAMDLRAKQEKEGGKPVSLAAIVRYTLKEQHKLEFGSET